MSTPQEARLLKNFGKRLAYIRTSKGMTQGELAERVNMSIVTISYIETGKQWARLSTLDKLARALGASIADLFEDV